MGHFMSIFGSLASVFVDFVSVFGSMCIFLVVLCLQYIWMLL